ncbi:MAG: arginyltransferase, partial [Gemmataceae bacterium]
CYWAENRLIGVGYVDNLPSCLSAIYFFYDPAERERSLGTFNVLSIIQQAQQLGKRFVHLGYTVEGCRSLEYKARFHPHDLRHSDGVWRRASSSIG